MDRKVRAKAHVKTFRGVGSVISARQMETRAQRYRRESTIKRMRPRGAPPLPLTDSLDLRFGSSLTDNGLARLIKRSPNLSVADLSGCKAITDLGLRNLAKTCPRLEIVKLRGCVEITNTGIRSLAAGCSSLRFVDLQDLPEVSNFGISALYRRCPGVEVYCPGVLVDLSKSEAIEDTDTLSG
jgi:hypothetical protein